MSNPNPINKDIKKTINSWLESLPYKKGDVVRCYYWCYYSDRELPPRDLKIEELEISSSCSSGVKVQLEGVRTSTGTELWLDSFWIAAPIEKPSQYLPEPGEIVNYVGGKSPQQLEVEEKVFTPDGWKVKFVGQSYTADLAYVFPIKKEAKAMTDIKWIPVDPNYLPEGEVLAIGKNRLRPVIGRIRVEYEGIYCQDGEGHSITPVAYLPLDDLHKMWEAQNPAARYSKDNVPFKLLGWIMESESDLSKAVVELTVEAEHTIKVLAQQMVRVSRLVQEAPCSPIADQDKFLEELIYWIKDYLAS